MNQRDATALARRLRALRRERRLTQHDVASALGVAVSSVSSWESTTSLKPPPAARLQEYAVLFAREGVPRLVSPDELTSAERAERDRLAVELDRLRVAAVDEPADLGGGTPRSLWHFPDGGPIRIICGRVSEPPAYIKARNHNYLQLSAYADIDALVELYGQLRAENPLSNVGFDLATRLEPDDLRSHLVLLGSTSMNPAARRAASLVVALPVHQVDDPAIADGEVFELTDGTGRRFVPRFVEDDPTEAVEEDVGLFFRTPNPYNVDRTLTICSGVFTRGVFGSVRFLTDRVLSHENEAVLAGLFGAATTFGLLMRVPVYEHATGTPDLRNPGSILYPWSKGPD